MTKHLIPLVRFAVVLCLTVGISLSGYAQSGILPVITINSVSPQVIRAQGRGEVAVSVTHTLNTLVTDPVTEAYFTVTDEYGTTTRSGELQVSNLGGSAAQNIYLEATVRGGDKDGRIYRIQLFVRNATGLGESNTVTVVVKRKIP